MGKVLVIDDETRVRQSLKKFLVPEGFEVASARSGAEGIRKHEANPADVVLLDMKMPKADGPEIARKIRAFDPRCSLVGVTAFKNDFLCQGEEAGIEDWVQKPLFRRRKEKLVMAVRRGVARSNRRSLNMDLGEELSRKDVQRLSAALEELSRKLSAQSRHGLTETQTRELAGASIMASVAAAVSSSGLAKEMFSECFFSEVESARSLTPLLRQVEFAKTAKRYERDMQKLWSLAGDKV